MAADSSSHLIDYGSSPPPSAGILLTLPSSLTSTPFLQWTEPQVATFLAHIGYPQSAYSRAIVEEGIDGETLARLDHETLEELGIKSLGHRLGILKAVWRLKVQLGKTCSPDRSMEAQTDFPGDQSVAASQGWEWNDDDWQPAEAAAGATSGIGSASGINLSGFGLLPSPSATMSSFALGRGQIGGGGGAYPQIATGHALPVADELLEGYEGSAAVRKLWETVVDQGQRLSTLERDYRQLLLALPSQTRDHLNLPEVASTLSRPAGGDSSALLRPHTGGVGRGHTRGLSTDTPPALSPSLQADAPPNPSTSTAPVAVHRKPAVGATNSSSSSAALLRPPTGGGGGGGGGGVVVGSAAMSRGSSAASSDFGGQQQVGEPSERSVGASTATGKTATVAANGNDLKHHRPSHSNASTHTASSTTSSAHAAREAAGAAAKSFKVTLDDPCWKVLPAALKKYKINDDWRQYAMFICYGNTERCLSYDEKPLLLFQKLKESDQKPVFMLRHIREIVSPIALAQQKQQARAQSGVTVSGRRGDTALASMATKLSAPATSTTSSAPNTASASPNTQQGYTKDTRLHKPPVLQPISAKARAATASALGSGKTTPGSGAQANFPDLPSPGLRFGATEEEGASKVIGYAVAIYPYAAEREDEFEVLVGMAFVVLNKAKGWWVVQRDLTASGDVALDETKTGWVPSGCLLETTQPVAIGNSSSSSSAEANPLARPLADQPIKPNVIASSSFQGVALMDYDVRGEDELQLHTHEPLRVFKRYAHWSYCVKEDGTRGWVPSWFVAKVPSGSSANTSVASTTAAAAVAAANDTGRGGKVNA